MELQSEDHAQPARFFNGPLEVRLSEQRSRLLACLLLSNCRAHNTKIIKYVWETKSIAEPATNLRHLVRGFQQYLDPDNPSKYIRPDEGFYVLACSVDPTDSGRIPSDPGITGGSDPSLSVQVFPEPTPMSSVTSKSIPIGSVFPRLSVPSFQLNSTITSFIETYTGTPAFPAPFGGREADLNRLDLWLDDKSSKPYALLSARGGVGKSALLVHWALRVSLREDIHVVFVPISVRFGLSSERAVFSVLATQIRTLLPHESNQNRDDSHCRMLFQELCREPPADGKTILLILDGFDEATGWEADASLFPTIPPSHLRVLASSRPYADDPNPSYWLQRLNWASSGLILGLEGLDETGIQDVLRQMGNPLDQLAPREEVTSILLRVTDGDPLVVGLYIEELRRVYTGTLQFDATLIRSLKPGLAGIFSLWWDYQIRIWGTDAPLYALRVRMFLKLCTIAIGPLTVSDLVALAPEVFEDTLLVHATARDLRRFLIQTHDGWIFTHPNLAQHYGTVLSKADHEQLTTRFINYGDRTVQLLLADAIPPISAPEYVVRYHVIHLERSQMLADYYRQILSVAWCRAWEALDASYGGFYADMNRVLRNTPDGPRRLAVLTRAKLFACSLGTTSRQISPPFFLQFMRWKTLTPRAGLAVARQQFSDFRCTYLLGVLLACDATTSEIVWQDVLSEMARHSDIERVMELFLESARLGAEWSRTDIIATLSASVAHLKKVTTIRDARAFISLLESAPSEEEIARARIHRAAYWPIDRRSRTVIQNVVKLDLESGDELLHGLLAELQGLSNQWILPCLSSLLLARKEPNNRTVHLNRALDVIENIGTEEIRFDALRTLAPHFASAPSVAERAFDLSGALRNEPNRAKCLVALLYQSWQPSQEILSRGAELADGLNDNWSRGRLLGALARHVSGAARSRFLDDALRAVTYIGAEASSINLLGALSARLPPDHHGELRRLGRLLADRIPDTRPKAKSLVTSCFNKWFGGLQSQASTDLSDSHSDCGAVNAPIGGISQDGEMAGPPLVGESRDSSRTPVGYEREPDRCAPLLALADSLDSTLYAVRVSIYKLRDVIGMPTVARDALCEIIRAIPVNKWDIADRLLSSVVAIGDEWVIAYAIDCLVSESTVTDSAIILNMKRVVAGLRYSGPRCLALSALGFAESGKERHSLQLRALEAAERVQNSFARFQCSVGLARLSSGEDRHALLTRALDFALDEKKVVLRAQMLSRLVSVAGPEDTSILGRIAERGMSGDSASRETLPALVRCLLPADELAAKCISHLCARGSDDLDVSLLDSLARGHGDLVEERAVELVTAFARDHRPVFVRALTALIPALKGDSGTLQCLELAATLSEIVNVWP